ncbi:hypothetical protein ASE36_06910 [Rhizobium sp. Root274]|uniref:hypothetical protein n=1 Tax=unclassified Rhizobium TaxID=2613769 RepID=UPI000713F108|nr:MULTISPECIES: hypothetical protein [unclassified Rhizobium]KQW31929.1 hypothetical protein ASC71_06920 [Rhizobium sp. Root1240]KRD33468.1 hypothetical protein ASE36_06910 [Rhizobium sp. Root274]
MFKLFWKTAVRPRDQVAKDWRYDPLGHPELLGMSPRELADLPMVTEVALRVGKVEVADGCRGGVGGDIPAGCVVSR